MIYHRAHLLQYVYKRVPGTALRDYTSCYNILGPSSEPLCDTGGGCLDGVKNNESVREYLDSGKERSLAPYRHSVRSALISKDLS